MGRKKKEPVDKDKRFRDNEISPSKYRSPTRNPGDNRDEIPEKGELVWNGDDCELSDFEMGVYFQSTQHLPKDIALRILMDKEYDTDRAVEFCNGMEWIEPLTPLEKKVLLSAAPIANTDLGVKCKPAVAAEKHIYGLLPSVPPQDIRNFYNTIGREGCIPPRGWVPPMGHILKPAAERLVQAGLITSDEDSPLYEKPGRRVLRSAAAVASELNVIPRKLGKKSNDLAIAMVGYDQNQSGDEDASPDRRPLPRPPASSLSSLHRNIRSASARPSDDDRQSREGLPKRGRGRPRKNPLPFETTRSPLGLSSRPSSPSQVPTSSSSSSSTSTPISSPSSNGIAKKRRDPLEIAMNWSPTDNGARSRRLSAAMENGSPSAADRRNWRESSTMSCIESPDRRMTRSSSVMSEQAGPSSPGRSPPQFSPPRRSRDKLQIDMVGWNQEPVSKPAPKRDSDGFVIPSLPRSPFKSPTRSRQPTPTPPASPEI